MINHTDDLIEAIHIMKNQNIIIVGQQSWDTDIGSNCKNIALEFSKNNSVLYVNPPLDRITKYRDKSDPKIQKRLNVISGSEPGLVEITDSLYNLYPDCLIESINWIRNARVFDILNKVNNKRFANSIIKTLKELGFSNYILFNDNDIFRSYYLKELLSPAISIYYSRDNMVATSYWRRHGLVLEPKLISKNDLCVANSEYLKNYCKKFNANSKYVGQGCDLTLFGTFESDARAKEIQHLKFPVIGYVGVLTAARLDIDLIYAIAESQPDWNIVLVGPEDEEFKASALHRLPNVCFLGPRKPEELPAYIHSFDICINPQVLNDLTIGNYPRKIDEYLSLGKPTVATKTESMDVFKDHVSLATGKAEYIDAINTLLISDTEESRWKRKQFALSHTWENSVQLIYDGISHTLSRQL